jgi:hypothetical protein
VEIIESFNSHAVEHKITDQIGFAIIRPIYRPNEHGRPQGGQGGALAPPGKSEKNLNSTFITSRFGYWEVRN